MNTRSPASHLLKDTFLLQIIEITGRSLLDCICNLLILRIGDFPVYCSFSIFIPGIFSKSRMLTVATV